MKIYRIITVCLVAVALSACIKDKGNYTYVKIDEIISEFDQSIYRVASDESIEIIPKIRYFDKNITDIPDVTYEWYIDEELLSTAPTYIFNGSGVAADKKLTLVIEDKKSGFRYGNTVGIYSESALKSGFMMLHEDAQGNAEISFISSLKGKGVPNDKGKANDTIFFKKEYKNIYALHNNGAAMGKNGVSLTEHSALNTRTGALMTEVTVITENGARMEDLNGFTFKKETSIEDEFKGGMPDVFNPKTALHLCWDSYIVDRDGRMFTRRNALADTYHTGFFNKKSTYNGEVKYDDIFFTFYYYCQALLALEFDQEGKRNFIGISCAFYNGERDNGARMTVVPARGKEALMAEVQDVKGEYLFDDYCIDSFVNYYENLGQYFITKEDSKYYLRYFEFAVSLRSSTLTLHAANKIDLTPYTGGRVVLGMASAKVNADPYPHVVFFHDGVKIYSYSFDTKRCVELFDGKGKTIAAFDVHTKIPYYGKTDPEPSLAVAFDDGSVEIYELERSLDAMTGISLFKTTENYGKIKQIVYKQGTSGAFLGN